MRFFLLKKKKIISKSSSNKMKTIILNSISLSHKLNVHIIENYHKILIKLIEF